MPIHNVNLDTGSIRSYDEYSPEVSQHNSNQSVVAVILVRRSEIEEDEPTTKTEENIHYNRPPPPLTKVEQLGEDLAYFFNMLF